MLETMLHIKNTAISLSLAQGNHDLWRERNIHTKNMIMLIKIESFTNPEVYS